MTAGVLHSLWLHGRHQPLKTCRRVLVEPFCPGCSPVQAANEAHKPYFADFLATPEADEPVGVVLARHGASARA